MADEQSSANRRRTIIPLTDHVAHPAARLSQDNPCVPGLAERKLALVHFILSASSAIFLPVGIGLAILRNQPAVAIVASLLWVAGVLVFFVQLISLLGTSAREKDEARTDTR